MTNIASCSDCGHARTLHYGPEGVCVADCRSLTPLIQCGCKEFRVSAVVPQPAPSVEEARTKAIDRLCDCEVTTAYGHDTKRCRQIGIDALDALILAVQAHTRDELLGDTK